jgi:hypothetical protein
VGVALFCLLAPGCSWVHQRQALDIKKPGPVLVAPGAAAAEPRDREPIVKLGVDSAEPTDPPTSPAR